MTVKSSVAYIEYIAEYVFAQGYMITTFTELNAIHITQIILFQPHIHTHMFHTWMEACVHNENGNNSWQYLCMLFFFFDGRRHQHHRHRLCHQQPGYKNRKKK